MKRVKGKEGERREKEKENDDDDPKRQKWKNIRKECIRWIKNKTVREKEDNRKRGKKRTLMKRVSSAGGS